ncbi:thioesterase family protein [Shewanella sp. GXUN23E]|uniref:thioesterase family protein n=1 Tax=Shewanella sp. GXUN23E TaxID=3422498 RepID=UPI003D7DBB5C
MSHPSTDQIQERALAMVAEVFDQHIPFHKLLGLRIDRYDLQGVEVRITMKPELIGNIHQQILHGGVTATVLDVVGGLTAFAGLVASRDDWQEEELKSRLMTLGTIDMRVDYLRPGRGNIFTGTGQVIRSGNKVSVCRMELHNEQGEHIAFGTGTYLTG